LFLPVARCRHQQEQQDNILEIDHSDPEVFWREIGWRYRGGVIPRKLGQPDGTGCTDEVIALNK